MNLTLPVVVILGIIVIALRSKHHPGLTVSSILLGAALMSTPVGPAIQGIEQSVSHSAQGIATSVASK